MLPDPDEQVEIREAPPRELRLSSTRISELSADRSYTTWPDPSVSVLTLIWSGREGGGGGGGGRDDLFHAFRKLCFRFVRFSGALCGAVGEHGGSSVDSARVREVEVPWVLEPSFKDEKPFGLIKWRVSMIECSGLFEALRPEEGGRDFDRRLLLIFPWPPLPEDNTNVDSL